MSQRKAFSLPTISFNSVEFAEQAFASLKSFGAFVVKDAPGIASSASTLLKQVDDFLYQPSDVINQFRGGTAVDDLPGVHLYEDHWAGRRFSSCYGLVADEHGRIMQPLFSEDFRRTSTDFIDAMRNISRKTLSAIDAGFNLKSKLTKFFDGSSILGIADIYTPPTQEKINDLISKRVLTITDDARVDAFTPHKDINPLTGIFYSDNDCTGLEMALPDASGSLSYKPIVLPEVEKDKECVLVLLGKPIEILTDGQLRAPEHRVMLDPLLPGQKFKRSLASAFTLFGPNSERVEPLLSESSGPHSAQSTKEYYGSEIEKINKEQATKVLDIFPTDKLSLFPKEVDIVRERSTKGTVYFRR